MMGLLGVRVTLCASFGGEVGRVVRNLVIDEGLGVEAVETAGTNGAYVHDRRGGERETVAYMRSAPLSRHEVDELYGAALVSGMETDLCVLGGPVSDEVVPAEMYRRLASDLTANGRLVVADLSGEQVEAALEGGVTVLKVSHEELMRDGRLDADRPNSLERALRRLADAGAANVIVTRADEPAVALVDGEVVEVVAPPLEALDPRGAGDSFTAGLSAALARGTPVREALQLAAAAGGLNVTRRGLATGSRDEIETMASHVEVRPFPQA